MSSPSQKIPPTELKKVHCDVHKTLPLVSVLGHMNSVCTLSSRIFKNILPSMTWSSAHLLPSRFPTKSLYEFLFFSTYITFTTHFTLLNSIHPLTQKLARNTVCPTRYRTRHFFNNSNTNEDNAMEFEQEYVRCVRNEKECVCSAPNCCDTHTLLTPSHTQPAARRSEPSMSFLLILAFCQ